MSLMPFFRLFSAFRPVSVLLVFKTIFTTKKVNRFKMLFSLVFHGYFKTTYINVIRHISVIGLKKKRPVLVNDLIIAIKFLSYPLIRETQIV